jgi:hypothetical protein
MDEEYAKSYCLKCGNGIEFLPSQLEGWEVRVIPCPHCGLQTNIYAPMPKKIQAVSPPVSQIKPNYSPAQTYPDAKLGRMICPNPNCGYVGPGKSEGHGAVGLLLGALFIPAGIAYLGVMGSKCICPKCGTRTQTIPPR